MTLLETRILDTPIIPGFHPDPSICRVGGSYFLATSSFEYFPGVPVFRSDDLATWTQIGHALTRRSQFRLVDPGPSRGIYAPTLRHHEGRFWLVTTNISDVGGGQLAVWTDDPAGEWSDPVFIPQARGIDPDLAWDADGTCYLTWNALELGVGNHGIRQAPVDLATGLLQEEPYPVWQGTGMQAPEGPHLYRIGEWWYLLLAEGGTERGHAVTIARARSPRGPFEPCPSNPILTHRSSDHPVQNVGHADLVQRPDGEWAAVFLGARPSGSTPGFHVNGRETFLAGVDWVDGWPVVDETRYAALPTPETAFADDFADAALDLRWVAPDGEPHATTAPMPGGGLRLLPRDDDAPAICARIADARWEVDARFAGDGALRLWMDPRHWYGLRREDGRVVVETSVGTGPAVIAGVDDHADAVLRIRACEPLSRPVPLGGGGPDDIELAIVVGESVDVLARLDGRYLSTEVAGGFTGRMIALSAAGEDTILQRVDYRPEAFLRK